MVKKHAVKALWINLGLALLVAGCTKKEAALPDNLVNFETTSQGIAATENSLSFKVKLSRNTDQSIPVVVKLTNTGIAYTTEYTTTPAANGSGEINLTIPSGNNEASFTVAKVPGVLYDGDETIVFDIYSSGSPVLIGTNKQLTLTFAELIANSSTATIDGGGPTYPNKVFIDLSANRQTPVLRTNWDLGFYTGSDDFRVTLNSSSAMMAKQIAKDDLNAVTAADTVGFSTDVVFSQFTPTAASLAYIDYPNGDLTKTAIAAISATAADNKVYIINRGTGVGSPAPQRGWKKVRIIRNGSGGYTLQHADIAATSFTSVDISKDDAYFFKYISFENGAVSVEPQKKKWDIAWTFFSNMTTILNPATQLLEVVPYTFQDMVLLNRNVQVDTVMTAFKPYTDFGEADLASLTFISSQTGIGSDWRSGGGPTSQPFVRTDRYYIIKDGDNNYYKVRFTALTQNNERGFPAFESVLVKKGG